MLSRRGGPWLASFREAGAVPAPERGPDGELPDCYEHVAREVMRYCAPKDGVWVDLESGAGPGRAHLSRPAYLRTMYMRSAVRDGASPLR